MPFDAKTRRLRQNPRDAGFYGDPYPLYSTLRAAPGPVFWEEYGCWCFARHASVSALLRDRRFGRQILHLATREELGWPPRPAHLGHFDALERHSLLELEPPAHTRLRGLVNRAFVSRRIEGMSAAIAALAERLLDGLAPGDDFIAGFATPIPVAVIAELLGAPAEDAGLLLDWSHRIVAMYRLAPSRAEEDAADAAARDFANYMRDLIGERRRVARDDLLSQLIAAQSEQGKISDDELATTAILLLNAGHEATVHALGNAVKTALEHDVVPVDACACEELLRFDAPLHMFTRYALVDVEIEGVKLGKGAEIGLLLGAANRDPAAFADPDRLDLGRAPNPHVSFGAGIHFCVGAALARLEMRIALSALFGRLPNLALAETPRYRDAYHFHGLEALRLRW